MDCWHRGYAFNKDEKAEQGAEEEPRDGEKSHWSGLSTGRANGPSLRGDICEIPKRDEKGWAGAA